MGAARAPSRRQAEATLRSVSYRLDWERRQRRRLGGGALSHGPRGDVFNNVGASESVVMAQVEAQQVADAMRRGWLRFAHALQSERSGTSVMPPVYKTHQQTMVSTL